MFRSHNVFLPNVKQKIVTEIKRNIYSKSVFKELNEHCTGQELFNTHRDQVIVLIITTYLNIRFHAATTKEKKDRKQWEKNIQKWYYGVMSNFIIYVPTNCIFIFTNICNILILLIANRHALTLVQ